MNDGFYQTSRHYVTHIPDASSFASHPKNEPHLLYPIIHPSTMLNGNPNGKSICFLPHSKPIAPVMFLQSALTTKGLRVGRVTGLFNRKQDLGCCLTRMCKAECHDCITESGRVCGWKILKQWKIKRWKNEHCLKCMSITPAIKTPSCQLRAAVSWRVEEFEECDVCSSEKRKDYWSHIMQWKPDGALPAAPSEWILMF